MVGMLLLAEQDFAMHTGKPGTSDTTKVLPPLLVNGINYSNFFHGSKIQQIGDQQLNGFRLGNLGQVLDNQSMLFVKSYGPGMLSTPGFRGGSAAQTAVLWNGFNLQSPMNGTVDLSLIPVFLIEQTQVQYGSPAALFGSGNIGGAIHLQTHQLNTTGAHGELMLGAGSFGNKSLGLKLGYATSKFSVTHKVFGQFWDNQFRYYPGSLIQPSSVATTASTAVANHAALTNKAWLQEYRWNVNRHHQLNASLWLQQTNRQLPDAFGSNTTQASQEDAILRGQTMYHYTGGPLQIQLRYSGNAEQLKYADLYHDVITSNAQAHTLTNDYFMERGNFHYQFSIMAQRLSARFDATSAAFTQERYAAYGTLQHRLFNQRLQQQLSVRAEQANNVWVPLMPAYGLQYKLKGNRSLLLSVARSYRLPTFNDLYWPGMGNPNLQPELGMNYECSYRRYLHYDPRTFRGNPTNVRWSLFYTLTLYSKTVDNWIVWVPQGGNLSRPMNIYKVWSRGTELSWKLSRAFHQRTISFVGFHQLGIATNEASLIPNDAGLHKQLLYFPQEQHRLNLSLEYPKWNCNLYFNYTGTRFVTTDQTNWLNSYSTIGFSASIPIHFKAMKGTIEWLIQNLLNHNYQVIVNQPMPLINHQITLRLTL